MSFLSRMYIDLFIGWACRRNWRVLLVSALHALAVVALVIALWRSDSNLFIFAGPLASKIVAGIVLVMGLYESIGVLFVLSAQNSFEEHFWQPPREPGTRFMQTLERKPAVAQGSKDACQPESPHYKSGEQ